MARVTLRLFHQPERWIHRRVEKISFNDYRSVRHQVSVDFTLPAGMPPVGTFDGRDIHIAPLFLLEKSSANPLRTGKPPWRRFIVIGKRRTGPRRVPIPTSLYSRLDFVDQLGHRQPLLTQTQSRLLASTVLLMAAEQVVSRPITGDLRKKLLAIAHRPRSDLAKTLHDIFDDQAGPLDQDRYLLRNDPIFRELAYTFASHSVVACLFMDGPPRRSIYKLAYDAPVSEAWRTGRSTPRQTAIRVWARFRQSLGWKSEQLFVPLSEIGASASYHVEVATPAELEVNATGLVGHRYELFGKNPRRMTKAQREYSILEVESSNHGDVYIPEPFPGRRVGEVWVKLRAQRPGFLRGALVASIITSMVLWGAVIEVDDIVRADRSEAAVALLLLMPAILAAFVVRPGEHAITTRMLTWARIALVIDAALAFAAALFLMTTPSSGGAGTTPIVVGQQSGMLTVPMSRAQAQAAHTEARHEADKREAVERQTISDLKKTWTWLAIGSLVLILQFIASYIFPRPHGRTGYRPLPKGANLSP